MVGSQPSFLVAVVAALASTPVNAGLGCMDLAYEYCNTPSLSQCYHSVTTDWIPLHSGSIRGPVAAWRCYDPSCLNKNHSAYHAGSRCTDYCTRDVEIQTILKTCRLPAAPTAPPTPVPPAPTIGDLVWPPLQKYEPLRGSVALDPTSLQFIFRGSSPQDPTPPILTSAFVRYRGILSNTTVRNIHDAPSNRTPLLTHDPHASLLTSFVVTVTDPNMTLGPGVPENYSMLIVAGNPSVVVRTETVFGALRALETFVQLAVQANTTVDKHGATSSMLQVAAANITDWPQYAWRAFMVDTGRRFWPMGMIRWLLDAMALNKLNVLHLHISDFCRFAVESDVYPQLTTNLTGLQGGVYTKDDVRAMVEYATERGIRVVPEIDVPGHARGLLPLESAGLTFCSSDASRSQIYDDPANKTFSVIAKLFSEISDLFPDPVMNVGSDETASVGKCDRGNTAQLERKVLGLVERLGKTPMAWVNALTTTYAAADFPSTILDTWATVYGMLELVTSKGFDCVASTYMYLNKITGAAGNATNYWRDIAAGVAPADLRRVLGGEVSMWTDDFCYTAQCGAKAGPTPIAAELYGPDTDARFAASIAGILFPRASIGAGSFWKYESGLNSTSRDFVSRVARQNARMSDRGLDTCPRECMCDQLTRCGHPY